MVGARHSPATGPLGLLWILPVFFETLAETHIFFDAEFFVRCWNTMFFLFGGLNSLNCLFSGANSLLVFVI